MYLPSIMSVMVFPYVMTAIRRCGSGIQAILAQHVARVGQPGVERAKPVRHGGGGVRGSQNRQSCRGKQQDFISDLISVEDTRLALKHGPTSRGWKPPSGSLPTICLSWKSGRITGCSHHDAFAASQRLETPQVSRCSARTARRNAADRPALPQVAAARKIRPRMLRFCARAPMIASRPSLRP
jgi:hypothetical protein